MLPSLKRRIIEEYKQKASLNTMASYTITTPPRVGLQKMDYEKTSGDVSERGEAQFISWKKQLLAQWNDTTSIGSTPEIRVGKVKAEYLGNPMFDDMSSYAKLPSAKKLKSRNLFGA